jgi:hypothetical protein
LVSVPDDGVPRAGVTSVGDVAKTKFPEPVSPVTAAAKLALEGVPSQVPTPVPKPVIPAMGNPVPFVKVTADGVPKLGVVKVGDVANTARPEPVSSVNAVAKFADEGVVINVATPVPGVVIERAPVPPDVVTNPFDVRLDKVEIFCDVLTETVYGDPDVPVPARVVPVPFASLPLIVVTVAALPVKSPEKPPLDVKTLVEAL